MQCSMLATRSSCSVANRGRRDRDGVVSGGALVGVRRSYSIELPIFCGSEKAFYLNNAEIGRRKSLWKTDQPHQNLTNRKRVCHLAPPRTTPNHQPTALADPLRKETPPGARA